MGQESISYNKRKHLNLVGSLPILWYEHVLPTPTWWLLSAHLVSQLYSGSVYYFIEETYYQNFFKLTYDTQVDS